MKLRKRISRSATQRKSRDSRRNERGTVFFIGAAPPGGREAVTAWFSMGPCYIVRRGSATDLRNLSPRAFAALLLLSPAAAPAALGQGFPVRSASRTPRPSRR